MRAGRPVPQSHFQSLLRVVTEDGQDTAAAEPDAFGGGFSGQSETDEPGHRDSDRLGVWDHVGRELDLRQQFVRCDLLSGRRRRERCPERDARDEGRTKRPEHRLLDGAGERPVLAPLGQPPRATA